MILTKKASKKEKSSNISYQNELDLVIQTIAEYEQMFGIPSPPKKKIEQMVRTISHYNQMMVTQNKPERQIQVGDFILNVMLKMGLIAMFGVPIFKKWMPLDLNDIKTKTRKAKIESKSMVD